MIRIVLTVLVAGLLGGGLGWLQFAATTQGYTEEFSGANLTKAEVTGQFAAGKSTGTAAVEVRDGTEFNFGTMMHGEVMSHEFVVRNVGTGSLVLEKAGSTCKCTVGSMEKDALAPGEETIVKLTWTAETVMPMFGQTATFKTNDPSMTEIKFTVKGQVASSFVVEPTELSLGDVGVDQAVEESFYVFSYVDEPTELSDFRWTKEETEGIFRFETTPVSVDDTQYARHKSAKGAHKVTIKLGPGLPMGPMSGKVRFKTNLGETVGNLEVLLTARGVSDVSLIGGASFDARMSVLKIGNVNPAEGASMGVMLAIQGEDRDSIVPEIASWTPEDAMKVTIGEPRVSGKRKLYPIQIEVPKGAPEVYYPGTGSGTFGKIVVKTNHEKIREIPIYIQLVIGK